MKSIYHYIALYIFIVSALIGCQMQPTIPDAPKETLIPVGIPCLTPDQVPERPTFVTDAELDKMSDDRFVLNLASDRQIRMEYEGKLEAKLYGCVGTKAIPAPAPSVVVKPDQEKPWWKVW